MYAAARDTAELERFLDENETDTIRNERYVCSACGRESDTMRWHCPRCNGFDTYAEMG
jgi:lipopolysaccharide biosynthesis regulator YciM